MNNQMLLTVQLSAAFAGTQLQPRHQVTVTLQQSARNNNAPGNLLLVIEQVNMPNVRVEQLGVHMAATQRQLVMQHYKGGPVI